MGPSHVHCRDDGSLRILQLTDFHNDQGDDLAERTWQDVDALVARHQPDFLAVTGDIWCSDDEPDRGPARMRRDLDCLSDLGVPWAFAWGNHDFVDDLPARQREIAETPNAVMANGDGLGSVRVEVRRDDKAVWDMFFINSGGAWAPSENLAWFAEESARVAKARGRTVPALAYYHIPLREYENARLAHGYTGVAHEEVLCWGDDGDVLNCFKEAGNVRAGFCGHSHLNDFSFEADGILLGYGRVAGHGGYGGDILEKGATLLVVDTQTDSLSFQTVFADGRVWTQGA